MSSEIISFIYDQNTFPSKWKNTHSNMQVLTKIKNPTIVKATGYVYIVEQLLGLY